jgi:hypothetical protein
MQSHQTKVAICCRFLSAKRLQLEVAWKPRQDLLPPAMRLVISDHLAR